ncbi:GNAT family N-acetyltransferase [Paenibacillus glufosinatiresistens]|uniref:GNAT family N-acetyltransferase n=1 Tax=Paenibacillus glufosinatiresistens TaxID=3070657 RepID=UPI00286E5B0E|nr:GNAT family N-acetyltransferase [Paenibacillus sp. YX.27]
MACMEEIRGELVELKCADENDAQFSLDIRNDPTLTQFIPKVQGSLNGQINWILNERKRPDSFFYIILNKEGKRLGTASLYDIDKKQSQAEFGRYISYGNALENVEAALLILDFAFNDLGVGTVLFNNDERNSKIISFWKRFGAQLQQIVEMNGWKAAQYWLEKENYFKQREKIIALLARRS